MFTNPFKGLKATPPAAEQPAETAWAMSREEYDALMKKLTLVLENVHIVNDNVLLLERKLTTLQSDMGVSLNNEIILGRDQDELMEDVKKIKRAVNELNK